MTFHRFNFSQNLWQTQTIAAGFVELHLFFYTENGYITHPTISLQTQTVCPFICVLLQSVKEYVEHLVKV